MEANSSGELLSTDGAAIRCRDLETMLERKLAA
jgi:hypothetical protein